MKRKNENNQSLLPLALTDYQSILQTLFSLYFHNQQTDFHKLSCARKFQMRAIHIYIRCTKVTTNN